MVEWWWYYEAHSIASSCRLEVALVNGKGVFVNRRRKARVALELHETRRGGGGLLAACDVSSAVALGSA